MVGQGVAMVFLNGVPARHTGEDQLAAAAVTGEQVGRDAVDDDDLVRGDDVLVEHDLRAQLRRAHAGQLVVVAAVVLVHLDALRDFLTDDADILFRRLLAVRALGEDDIHVFIGHTGQVQLVDHMNHVLGRAVPRARHIGNDEAHLVPLVEHFLQGLAADGMAHGLNGCLFHVAGRHRAAFQHFADMFFRQFDILRRLADSKSEFLKSHVLSLL